MSITSALRAACLCAVLSLPSLTSADTIENPTDEQVVSLYHFMAGDPPNFEDEARKDTRYYSANEFDKPAILKQIADQKRALYEANADVDLILLRTGSGFGEYNADIGGYQFKIFEPGVYFPFGQFRQYGLTMENAADFRDWTMPVADARALRDEAPYGRLTFEIALRPFGVVSTREKHIRGQIVGVKAFTQTTNRLVFEAALDASDYRPIAGADSPTTERPLEDDKIALQGVRLGIDRTAFEEWIAERGYTAKGGSREVAFGTNVESINLHNSSGQLQAVGNIDYDPVSAGVFGKDFDCRSVDDRLHSCGYAKFDEDGVLVSMVLLQSALGATKQQIVSSMNQAYGSPADRFNVSVRNFIRGEQFVWGLSSTELGRDSTSLTDVSGAKHWQVEAVITEPSTERLVVIVQINQITQADGSNATAGGGQIKF